MKRIATQILLGFALAGCGSLTFTEADRGREIRVGVGAAFTVSLPSSPATMAGPQIPGGIAQMTGRRTEGGRDLFEFKAVLAGDADLKIGDFSMHLRVLSPEEEPRIKVGNY